MEAPRVVSTPYVNTIPAEKQAPFPGDWEMERRIKSYVRWNAMAMVVNANREHSGLGGHISTYASSATLVRGRLQPFLPRRARRISSGDMVYFQGHATPGIYARAFLEGRLDERHLQNFRQELAEGGGLSSYPHPYLMPDFWQFPTVSMGLGPLLSIYQARFNRYLRARGFINGEEPKVWAFHRRRRNATSRRRLGSLTLASRENLDNLIWVVNCNLQRLDGPVRGNGKIIQELEARFQGAGWNVIKVIWGSDWDKLLAADKTGLLLKRMEEAVDGDYQKYSVEPGSYTRRHFFGKYPELLELVNHLTRRADPQAAARRPRLAQGLCGLQGGDGAQGPADGDPGQDGQRLRPGRSRRRPQHHAPAEEAQRKGAARVPRAVRHPGQRRGNRRDAVLPPGRRTAARRKYLLERRKKLWAGSCPQRIVKAKPLEVPKLEAFARVAQRAPARIGDVHHHGLRAAAEPAASATRPSAGRSCRSFPTRRARSAWTRLFREIGIYSPKGQLYEPVDSKSLLYYHEAKDGQILEEGITEAGSMASFIAAGTSYATTAATWCRSTSTTRCSASSASAI